MASSSLLSSRTPVLPSPAHHHRIPPTTTRGIVHCSSRTPISSLELSAPDGDERYGRKRREALLQMILTGVTLPWFVAGGASAETDVVQESYVTYKDDEHKFRIVVSKDWLVGTGESDQFKSVTAFYPTQTSDSNVSVVITGVGADFTSLKSFGDVDAFAETLVSGLDRSWKDPPGVAAKLISSKAANGLYYLEYTLQNPGDRCRHIVSALGMASNGWTNRLYTVTGQFMEDDSAFKTEIEKIVSSFRLDR